MESLQILSEITGLTPEQLTEVISLDLSGKSLHSLPEGIAMCTKLKKLYVEKNKIQILPAFLGNLTSLEILDISDNPIIELPEEITKLTRLKYLRIEARGNITVRDGPIGITSLPCWSNDDEPPFKSSTMSISQSLQTLRFYGNFKGQGLTDIASKIGTLGPCHELDISDNNISTIPDAFSTLTNLQKINISGNKFTSIPDVMFKMTQLKEIDISRNPIQTIPDGVINLPSLERLEIADSTGKKIVKQASSQVSSLPCFNTDPDLKKLTSAPVSNDETIPAQLLTRRLATSTKINPVDKKLEKITPPLLVIQREEGTEGNADLVACKNGITCNLCLGGLKEPHILECQHAFCGQCISDSIQQLGLHPPYGCPTCHKASRTSEKVKSRMGERSTMQSGVEGEISTPCKYKKCKRNASYRCETCGPICGGCIDNHGKSNREHAAMVKEIKVEEPKRFEGTTCSRHSGYDVKYYCTGCHENPFKCCECLAEDHQADHFKQHDYFQYRDSATKSRSSQYDSRLVGILKRHEAQVNRKKDLTQKGSEMLDEKLKEYTTNCAEMRGQVEKFIHDLQELVDHLKGNMRMQIDNIERSYIDQLVRKSKELSADQARLRLASDVLSEAIVKYSVMRPSELHNIISYAKEITNVPAEDISVRQRVIRERLPRQILTQLQVLNTQLLVGASLLQSNNQPKDINPDLLWDTITDAESGNFFGTDEENSEILAYGQDKRTTQRTSANLALENEFRSIRGISKSKTGVVAVADALSHTVSLYDGQDMSFGFVLNGFIEPDSKAEVLFDTPCDVTFDTQGSLYVVDSGSKRILVFDIFDSKSEKTENMHHYKLQPRKCIDVSNLGGGTNPNIPTIVEVSEDGKMYVYCSEADRVLAFDKDLNFIVNEQPKPQPQPAVEPIIVNERPETPVVPSVATA
eukprot:TRINITY_DN2871_c0_g1_i15.p1 TRINITY_DN2871_c0_g1~~TRINITY_DN2871_c0_g1_i15.p1  ORF type:complete len:922 (-),score=123.03 TRINITY_DN2871_c0_g1_i15:269-3034(-)